MMEKASSPKFRRRNYFIKKGLQGSFVLSFSAAVLAGLFINLVAAYFLIDRELSGELYRVHLKIRTTSEVAWPILWRLGALTVAAVIAVSVFIGWLLTRRVEAPLSVFLGAVRKAAGGDLTGRLGGKEGMEGLPEAFDSMASSLDKAISGVRSAVEALDERSTALNTALGKDIASSRRALSGTLSGLSTEINAAMERISRLKV